MRPNASEVHVNTPLTMLSIAYMQQADDFIADRAFPFVPVDKQSDLYYIYTRADFNRNQMKIRAPGTESAGGTYSLSNTSYMCIPYGLHKDIPDQIRSNADAMINMDADAAEFLAGQALLNREINFVSDFMKTSVWATDIAGVSSSPGAGQVLQWNDDASTPIQDIRLGKETIKKNTGQRASKLVLGEPVWNRLMDHPDILDRVKGYGVSPSSPAIVLRQTVATILELDEILVAGSIQNSAVEGAAEASDFIAGKKALLLHAPKRPGLMTPSAGYTFGWRGYLGGTSPVQIKRFRMEHLEVDRVEIASAYDQKATGADLGYYFGSIVA